MHQALIKSQQHVCSVMLGWFKHEDYTRYYVTFEIWVLVLAVLSLALIVLRKDFCFVLTIAE